MDNSSEDFDVAVVGLGAMGAATLYQLAKRGVRAVGIDRFTPPHANGSSHGGTRVTREAVGEGPDYVPLAMRSHRIVVDLEREAGEPLLVKAGTLVVGSPSAGATPLHGADDFLEASMAMAKRFGVRHEMLDADELRRRYPQFRTFRDTDRGYLEPDAGYMRPEAIIQAQIDGAVRRGARVLTHTIVEGVAEEENGVVLATTAGPIRAKRVVVAAGPWIRKLLGAPYDRILTVTRQMIHWYEAENYAPYAPERMPVFIWFVTDRLEDYFTGFPVTDTSEGVKMVASREAPDLDHEEADLNVAHEDSLAFYDRHVGPNMVGVSRRVVNSAACFYTNTPDKGFILDDHPNMSRVFVVSACSGHGFKHSLGIGEAVAQRIVDGRSEVDLTPFRLARYLT